MGGVLRWPVAMQGARFKQKIDANELFVAGRHEEGTAVTQTTSICSRTEDHALYMVDGGR